MASRHPRDPGLARERTQLAWTRTTLSLIALGAALIKAAPVPGLVILGMGLACWATARHLPNRRPSDRLNGPSSADGLNNPRPADRRHVPLRGIAVILTLVSLATLVTTLLGPRTGPLTPPASRPAPSLPSR